MPARNPIVIAYHLIWTAYGWWLPNDPRGSMSRLISQDVLAELGELHYGRKAAQPTANELKDFYRKAEGRLTWSLLKFDTFELNVLASAFAEVIEHEGYTCWACAIMPDHVHILIRKHKQNAEGMIAALQRQSRTRLRELRLRHADHPVWGGHGYKVFLDHPAEVRRVIGYVESNPVKTGREAQRWPFVRAYDNWPLHDGHSPRSPYVRALRAAGRYP